MSEETLTAPAVQTTPVPENPQGSQSFVDEFTSMLTPPAPAETPPPEAGKPTEPPKETGPPAQPAEAPSETRPPEEPPKPAQTKDPVSLRKRLAEIEKEYSGYKLTAKDEQEKLARKIAEFEKRKFLTPEQEEHFSKLEARAKQLEAELESRDYKESRDFQTKHKSRWDRAYALAYEEVQGMQIDGPEGIRTASKADFDQVMQAGPTVYRQLAKELFGEDSATVIAHRNAIKLIEAEAAHDAKQHRENYEQTLQNRRLEAQRRHEHFRTVVEKYDAQLVEKNKELFSEDPADKEANEIMQKGLKFVDDSASQEWTDDERAGRTIMIRRMAGTFPKLVLLNRRASARIAELEKKVASLQGTDPGAAGEGGEGAPAGGDAKNNDLGGIDALIKEFDVTP